MEKEKLEIIRSEIVKFLSENEILNVDLLERFEIMHNIDVFLNPETYENNIRILNDSLNNNKIRR